MDIYNENGIISAGGSSWECNLISRNLAGL
jgi:hypothetical protein